MAYSHLRINVKEMINRILFMIKIHHLPMDKIKHYRHASNRTILPISNPGVFIDGSIYLRMNPEFRLKR